MLTFAMLNRRWPRASHALVEGVAASAPAAFAKYGLATATAQADLLAQISEETGGGTAAEENLNYTAERLVEVWPTRFRDLASAMPFAHNPKALADNVYGGRGGNVAGTDDGWDFRGRGALQTTFRDNYAMTANLTGLDCLANPDLLLAPASFLECACALWKNAALSPIADAGNFRLETLRLNGGAINLATRVAWRAIWREELGVA
jgi:putative chitinase